MTELRPLPGENFPRRESIKFLPVDWTLSRDNIDFLISLYTPFPTSLSLQRLFVEAETIPDRMVFMASDVLGRSTPKDPNAAKPYTVAAIRTNFEKESILGLAWAEPDPKDPTHLKGGILISPFAAGQVSRPDLAVDLISTLKQNIPADKNPKRITLEIPSAYLGIFSYPSPFWGKPSPYWSLPQEVIDENGSRFFIEVGSR